MRTLQQAEAKCSLLHDEVRALRAQLKWFKKQIYGGAREVGSFAKRNPLA